MSEQVLTANELLTGRVVWLTRERQWVSDIAKARLIPDSDQQDILDWAEGEAQELKIVAPYFMDVDEALNPTSRGRLREEIRRDGPTIDYLANDVNSPCKAA